MTPQVEAVIAGYLEKLQQECREKQWAILQTRKPTVVVDLQAESPEIQIAFLRTVLASAGVLAPAPAGIETTIVGKLFSSLLGSNPIGQRFNWLEFRALGSVVSNLLRRKLPLQPEDLADITRSFARYLQVIHYCFPLPSLISAVESGTRTAEVEGALRGLRDSLAHLSQRSNSKENRKLLERIDQYLEPRKNQRLVVGGPWSACVFAEVEKQSEADRSGWSDVFAHCLLAQSSTPSKAWRKRSEELIAVIGVSKVRDSAVRWLNSDAVPVTAKLGTQISDKDADYLKGFVWMMASVSEGLCQAVADVGLTCLRKIPNIGPVSARVGFACVNTLAEMPGMDSVAQLTRMRAKVKYAVALKLIEKALNGAAERTGLSRDDLEDMAVPTYGLAPDGRRSERFGECSVDLALVPETGEIELYWKNAASKFVKSPPAEVKENYASQLKEIKRTAADAQKMLSAQRLRIEQFLINERKINYEHWLKHFLDHPLLSAITKRLIWRFENGNNVTLCAWLDGQMAGWNNEPVADLGPGTMVQLWHPLQSDPQTILSWRCWLEDRRIVQPFKQAHREVYLMTPAEEQSETYSNRFAAHVIRQHQFSSLCRERGWQYRLMGSGFDGHNVPTLDVPRRSVKAEFWVDVPNVNMGADPRQATDQMSGSGINLFLLTDQVRFYRDNAPVRLAEIPPIVFSEIMRDVDLFVGVTSIGNDPTWVDRGEGAFGHQYWQSFAFGDLSQSGEIRRTILEKLIPQLQIASRCTLDGKFLVVRGDLHNYKIHLGSANVLMEPGSHYLCIVPDRGHEQWQKGSLYLPFDGDQTLAIILSKAFLLAADSRISDSTILRQIGMPRTPAQ